MKKKFFLNLNYTHGQFCQTLLVHISLYPHLMPRTVNTAYFVLALLSLTLLWSEYSYHGTQMLFIIPPSLYLWPRKSSFYISICFELSQMILFALKFSLSKSLREYFHHMYHAELRSLSSLSTLWCQHFCHLQTITLKYSLKLLLLEGMLQANVLWFLVDLLRLFA